MEKLGLRAGYSGFRLLRNGGQLGYEAGDRYEVSQACGERVILPKVRDASASTLVIADGFSCRHQIEEGAQRKPLHIAQVLRMALERGEYAPDMDGLARSTRLREIAIGAGIATVVTGSVMMLNLSKHNGGKEMSTTKVGAEVMVERLIDWGVDTIFGLPGDGINGFMEALRKHQDRLRYVHVRHEEVAAMAAVGYAKFTGQPGRLFFYGRAGRHSHDERHSGFQIRTSADPGDRRHGVPRSRRHELSPGCPYRSDRRAAVRLQRTHHGRAAHHERGRFRNSQRTFAARPCIHRFSNRFSSRRRRRRKPIAPQRQGAHLDALASARTRAAAQRSRGGGEAFRRQEENLYPGRRGRSRMP